MVPEWLLICSLQWRKDLWQVREVWDVGELFSHLDVLNGIQEGGNSSSGMIRRVVFICCMQAWMSRVWQLQCERIYIHPWSQRLGDFPVFFVLWKNKLTGKFLGLETQEWHFFPLHSGLPFCLQVGMSNQLGLPQDILSAFLAA